nr:MAG TPA: hypothetical protein [Bacteriophage sp.]DAO07773.1 MAG TPA: hypothetical protein [Caudoviricetes sp.]
MQTAFQLISSLMTHTLLVGFDMSDLPVATHLLRY